MYDNFGGTLPANSTITLPIDNRTASETTPPVSREMAVIQKLLAENLELASHVEQRLHAVLRPSPPQQAANGQSDPRSPNSPLTNDLESFKAQLSQLSNRYQDILNRLDI